MLKEKKISYILCGLCLNLASVSVHAFVNPIYNFTINGFVSGGLAISNANTITFVDPLFHQSIREVPLYLGIGQEPTAEEDTLGGIQVNMNLFDPKASIVVQLVATGSNNYNVQTDWAYFNYEFNDMFAVRVGRVLLPVLLYSDYVNVRYAYPWLRLPQEVYSLASTEDTGGVLLDFKVPVFNSWLLEITEVPFSSTSEPAAGVGNALQTAKVYGATDIRLSNENATFRIGYLHANVVISDLPQEITLSQGLIEAPCTTLTSFFDVRTPGTSLGGQCDVYLMSGPGAPLLSAGLTGAPDIANEFVQRFSEDVYSAGYDVRWHNFRSIGEYIYAGSSPNILIIPALESWYVSLGYRVQEVVTTFTYAQARTRNNNIRDVNSPLLNSWVNPFYVTIPGNFSPSGLPIGPSMQNSLDAFLELVELAQNSYSIDVRWDAIDSVALKAQMQWIDPKDKIGIGLFSIPPGKIVSIFSVGVDAVF